ncbi:MAG: hypothetical protein AAGF94_08210 [Pseudomonadota bacterium]
MTGQVSIVDRPLQSEFFFCDVLNPVPKGDLGSLEHPIFSLATRPDRRILEYGHNDVEVVVTLSQWLYRAALSGPSSL